MSGFGGYRDISRTKQKSQGQGASNTALAAVAFQDHMMRNLSLSGGLGKPRLQGPKPRSKNLKDVKSVVDTGRGRPSQKKEQSNQEREYVLDPKPPPPTLAQKLGLVEQPQQLLNEDDWQKLKIKSSERDDFKNPCVICKEELGMQQQVLLSCSHVFHRTCLQAFERFTGRKTCPMCRKEQYQTRIVHEGTRHYRAKCATKIQAVWRGYVVRCWYKKLRETVPPNDPNLRKKFYEEKLKTITDRMLRSMETNIDDFFAELDRNLETSRDIFKNFENASRRISEEEWEEIQLKAIERGHKECPICLTNLSGSDIDSPRLCMDTRQTDNSHKNPQVKKVKQDSRQLKNNSAPEARRKQDACFKFGTKPKSAEGKITPSKNIPGKTGKNGAPHASGDILMSEQKVKETVLLSCSHTFHKTCLEAFEELSVGERSNCCPVCRTLYQKRVLPQ